MKLEFRNLNASEIEVRIGSVNKGGAALMLYKDARCDQRILDETVGPLNWQRFHSRDNANCTVQIFDEDKKQWISKEDTGKESNAEPAKGLASDSFKRACFNWGIGRCLYSVSDLNVYFPAKCLKGFSYDEQKKKGSCFDNFKVAEITYVDGSDIIESLVIDAYYYGEKHHTLKFVNTTLKTNTATTKPASSQSQPTQPTQQPRTTQNQVSQQPRQTTQPSVTTQAEPKPSTAVNVQELFTDDEVILIGNCRGKKYGDVKQTAQFISFLNWVKNAKTNYSDEKQNIQFAKFKKLVMAS